MSLSLSLYSSEHVGVRKPPHVTKTSTTQDATTGDVNYEQMKDYARDMS